MAEIDVADMQSEDLGDVGRRRNLFSFEFIVDSVTDVQVECVVPGVGFRLMDYPTVIIYHTNPQRIEKLRKMIELETSLIVHGLDIVTNRPASLDLSEKDGTFRFRKGKSTLFNMEFEIFFHLLKNVPVYIVLLDVLGDKPKLIGSCTLSLQSAVEDIERSFGLNNSKSPTLSSKVVTLDVFNLMGSVVAKIKGKYTLYSYGNSLSKHIISQNPSRGLDVFIERQGPTFGLRTEEKTTTNKQSETVLKKIRSIEKSTNTDDFKEKLSNVKHMDHEELKAWTINDEPNVKSRSIEKKKPLGKIPTCLKERKLIDYDFENSTCCPPPLIYNSEYKDQYDLMKSMSNTAATIDDEKIDLKTLYGNLFHQTDKQNSASDQLEEKQLKKERRNKVQYDPDDKPDLNNVKMENRFHSIQNEPNEEGELENVLKSLNGMPLLQGLLKEIVSFSRKGPQLNDHRGSIVGPMLSTIPSDENEQKIAEKPLANQNQGKKGVHSPKKHLKKHNGNTVTKKLKFKLTKSHQLRCAVNSHKNSEQGLQLDLKSKDREETSKDTLRIMAESHSRSKDPQPKRVARSRIMKLSKNFSSQNHHVDENLNTEIGAMQNIENTSLKSKSPVSLEIHLPSTAESEDKGEYYAGSLADGKSFDSNSFGDTGIYTPPPLEKKWMGLDDLSKMKQSIDDINDRLANLSGSEKRNRYSEHEVGPEMADPSNELKQRSMSLYSEEFHSVTKSSVSSKVNSLDAESEYSNRSNSSVRKKIVKVAKSVSDRSATSMHSHENSASTSSSSKSSGTSSATSNHSFRSIRSTQQSKSIDSPQSKKSLPRMKTSDASRPIISAHSPTTSRSLRTKPRQSIEMNDEITQSVDVSDVSFRTDDSELHLRSLKKESQSDSEPRMLNEKRIPDHSYEETYSDEFIDTAESRPTTAMDDHRTPTPKHVILSQAKLGYTM